MDNLAAAPLSIEPFLNKVNQYILNPLITLGFAVAFITFLWGVVEFIRNASGDDSRERGKRNIMWGIIGMLIMISVYGIINIILSTFGFTPPSYISGAVGN